MLKAGRIGVLLFLNEDVSVDAAENTIRDILTGTFTNVAIEVLTTQRLDAWFGNQVIRRDPPSSFGDIINTDPVGRRHGEGLRVPLLAHL